MVAVPPHHPAAAAGRSSAGWSWAGIVAGVGGLLTIVIATAIDPGEDALADNARLVAEVQGDEWLVWAYQVTGVGTAAALVLFALGLKRRLGQQEPAGSLVPGVVAAGLLLTAGMCLVGSGISTELYSGLADADQTDPDTIGANAAIFATMGWVWAGVGLTAGAVALAGRRGSVSRRLGRTSLAAAGLIGVTQVVPLQYLALLPASLWLLAAGVSFVRSEREGVPV